MNEDLDQFLTLLLSACGHIGSAYFQLPVAGQEDPEYRERVYAYELYHQLRSRWPDSLTRYTLGGEVDKNGHRLVRGNLLDKVKPDLIVHIPGTMDHNLAVIEIKPWAFALGGVRTDVLKLAAFCDSSRGLYAAGYFHVYGSGDDDIQPLLNEFRNTAASVDEHDKLHLVLHKRSGERAISRDWSADAA